MYFAQPIIRHSFDDTAYVETTVKERDGEVLVEVGLGLALYLHPSDAEQLGHDLLETAYRKMGLI